MIAESALYWPEWRQLSASQQKSLFEQVLRYFVHPLWSVAAIRPLTTANATTWQAELNGRVFYLEPGHVDLTGQRTVAPFLISQQITPANQLFIGQIDPVTGASLGNQFGLQRYRSTINDYLQQKVSTLNPFAQPTNDWQHDDLTFKETADETVAIFQRQHWSIAALAKKLRNEGGNLPTVNQWRAAVDGADEQANHWQEGGYDFAGSGLAFAPQIGAELLTDHALVQPNPFATGPASTDWAPIPVELPAELPAKYGYRTVLNVQLD